MPKLSAKVTQESLANIEERIKSKFFEMEKRLASLESAKSESTEERIKEVEDLQMLSQLEIMKTKEAIQAMPEQRVSQPQAQSSDAERKINDLLQRMDGLESQKMTDKGASYFISKIVKEKKEIENEFDRLRSLKKDFDLILREKDEISQRVADSELNLEKVDAFYSKMKTIEERVSVEVDKIYNRMKSIEERIDESIDRTGAVKKSIENRISSVEEKFKIRSDKLESLRESLNARLALVDDKIRDLDSFRKMIGDVDTFRSGMEEEAIERIALEKNLQDLNKRFDDLNESINPSDINRRLEEDFVTVVSLEKKTQDYSKRFDTLDSKITAISSSINSALDSRIKSLDSKV